jgi:hypothetical protein
MACVPCNHSRHRQTLDRDPRAEDHGHALAHVDECPDGEAKLEEDPRGSLHPDSDVHLFDSVTARLGCDPGLLHLDADP